MVALILCVIGIVSGALLAVDYGQEYTKAVLLAPSVPIDVILSADSKRKDVSGVAFEADLDSDGGIIRKYGFHALNTCVRKPAGCFTYIKSLLGKPSSAKEVTEYANGHSGIEIVDIKQRNSTGLRFGKQVLSVEELVAMNLADIKKRAQAKWDELSPNTYNVIDQVALTVPRYFTQAERQALVDSAEIAGLKVAALVDDGSCVATDFAEHRDFTAEKQYHVFYDMGAGSTRATLVSFAAVNGTVRVAVEGYGFDRELGGHALTSAVRDILEEKFLEQQAGVGREALEQDARAMNRLWQAADRAKLVLSANTETRVSVEMLYHDNDFSCTVTRPEFEARIGKFLRRVAGPLARAVSRVDAGEIRSVVLAGGSTRVPAVQAQLAEYLNGTEKIAKNVNADEAGVFGLTARGAAVAGYRRRKIIDVEDSIESNFTVKVIRQGEQTLEPLLARGSEVQPVTSHRFESLENYTGPFSAEILENGVSYKRYEFEAAQSNCSGGLTYRGAVEVATGKLVGLGPVEVACGGVDATADARQSGPVEYTGVCPVDGEMLRRSAGKLAVLDREDRERVQREELLNGLESYAYGLRSYLEEDTVGARAPAGLLQRAGEFTGETLGWLEGGAVGDPSESTGDAAAAPGESTGHPGGASRASVHLLKKRLERLRRFRRRLAVYVDTPDEDLMPEKFVALSNRTSGLVNRVQDYMMTMSEDAARMKAQYESLQLDFDAANRKLKYRMKEKTEKDLKTAMDDISQFSSVVREFEQDTAKHSAMSRPQLVELRQLALGGLRKLKKSLKTLQSVHDLRLGSLREQLEILKAEKGSKSGSKSGSSTILTSSLSSPSSSSALSSSHSSSSSPSSSSPSSPSSSSLSSPSPSSPSSSSSSSSHQHDEL